MRQHERQVGKEGGGREVNMRKNRYKEDEAIQSYAKTFTGGHKFSWGNDEGDEQRYHVYEYEQMAHKSFFRRAVESIRSFCRRHLQRNRNDRKEDG